MSRIEYSIMLQIDRLQSDSDLLKSIHSDELRELEDRLTGNLSDKEKKVRYRTGGYCIDCHLTGSGSEEGD